MTMAPRSKLGGRLPHVLRQHFAPLSSDRNLQGLNSVVRLAVGLALNIRPDVEIESAQI